MGELLYLGVKEVGIDPHYCDCARAAEQIIGRGESLNMLDNAQRWLLLGMLVLAGAGLLLRWRAAGPRGLFTPAWRRITLALALVMAVATITTMAQVDTLSDVSTGVAAAILIPIWAVATARGLPATSDEALP